MLFAAKMFFSSAPALALHIKIHRGIVRAERSMATPPSPKSSVACTSYKNMRRTIEALSLLAFSDLVEGKKHHAC